MEVEVIGELFPWGIIKWFGHTLQKPAITGRGRDSDYLLQDGWYAEMKESRQWFGPVTWMLVTISKNWCQECWLEERFCDSVFISLPDAGSIQGFWRITQYSHNIMFCPCICLDLYTEGSNRWSWLMWPWEVQFLVSIIEWHQILTHCSNDLP